MKKKTKKVENNDELFFKYLDARFDNIKEDIKAVSIDVSEIKKTIELKHKSIDENLQNLNTYRDRALGMIVVLSLIGSLAWDLVKKKVFAGFL